MQFEMFKQANLDALCRLILPIHQKYNNLVRAVSEPILQILLKFVGFLGHHIYFFVNDESVFCRKMMYFESGAFFNQLSRLNC